MPRAFILPAVLVHSPLIQNLSRSRVAFHVPFVSVMFAGLFGSMATLPVHFQVPPIAFAMSATSAGGFGGSIFGGSAGFTAAPEPAAGALSAGFAAEPPAGFAAEPPAGCFAGC